MAKITPERVAQIKAQNAFAWEDIRDLLAYIEQQERAIDGLKANADDVCAALHHLDIDPQGCMPDYPQHCGTLTVAMMTQEECREMLESYKGKVEVPT